MTDNNSGFPGINITGYSPLGDSAFFPLVELENIYQVLDNVTFIRGSHTFKAGVDYKKIQRNFTQILGAPAGSFGFGGGDSRFTSDPSRPGGVTGNAFADFLLGLTSSGNLIRNSGLAGLRQKEFSSYFQDTWKVNEKLTLNYGVRYDLITPQTEAYDRQTRTSTAARGRLILPEAWRDPSWIFDASAGKSPTRITSLLASDLPTSWMTRRWCVLRYGMFYMAQGQVGFQLTLNAPFVGGLNYVNTPEQNMVVENS